MRPAAAWLLPIPHTTDPSVMMKAVRQLASRAPGEKLVLTLDGAARMEANEGSGRSPARIGSRSTPGKAQQPRSTTFPSTARIAWFLDFGCRLLPQAGFDLLAARTLLS
jgi:hypothetical protein